MVWAKVVLFAIAWLIAYAAMEHWSAFEKTITGALIGLGYFCYTTSKEVDKLKLRLDYLIYKLDGRDHQ